MAIKWFNWGKKKTEAEKEAAQNEILEQNIEQESEDFATYFEQAQEELAKKEAEEPEVEEIPLSNEEIETFSEEQAEEPEEKPEKKQNLFERLKSGLKKTRDSITTKIDQILTSFGKVDEELFEELEEVLITSDIGINASLNIISELREKVKREKITEASQVRKALMEIIADSLTFENVGLKLDIRPSVIVVIGVNGVGKTTSIGKLAHMLKKQGKKVTVAAADTFRAAAIDQLEIWTKRAGVEIIKHSEGADPSAVIFDAIQHCKSKGTDVLICDTAGRLHTKKNLMEELKKVFRVIQRELPGADIETLLVLDATTGQNAVQQAKTFSEVSQLTGLILTKLDGTAKGGIVVSIKSELNVPVKFIGVGEQMEDLQPFNPEKFVEALFGTEM